MAEVKIPILDVTAEIQSLWSELLAAVQGVLASGQFIMGPNVKALETEVAAYLGVRHAVAVNSGTDALVISLRGLGISPGDEVLTSAFSFFATAEAISLLGARPVFVDIDPITYNIDPARVAEKISSRSRAIIPVHLYGQAADMDPLLALAQQYGLAVVEDVAQAFGATYRDRRLGTLGKAAALSFFPSKILGACGDGGMVVTDDDQLAETARMLRVHGARRKYYNEAVGYNSRLDELQAAILRVKLPHVEAWCEARLRLARRYDDRLRDVPGLVPARVAPYARHVYHQYTVRLLNGHRDRVKDYLARAGIDTMVYYPLPLHRLPVYAGLGDVLPMAEAAAAQVLSLPIWPQMSEAAQQRVVAGLREALA